MYISTTLYTPAAFCTKATLLLLIARVFSVHPLVSKLIRIFILLILLAYVPVGFLKLFICKPISAYWDNFEMTEAGEVTGGNSSCRGQATLFMGDISISIITDVLILILPIIMAWRMQATWRQKLKITVLLGAGGAATVTTVVRAYLNVQFMHTTSMSDPATLMFPVVHSLYGYLTDHQVLQTHPKILPFHQLLRKQFTICLYQGVDLTRILGSSN